MKETRLRGLIFCIFLFSFTNSIIVPNALALHENILWTQFPDMGTRINYYYQMPDVNSDGVDELLAVTMVTLLCISGKTGEILYYAEPEHECEFVLVLEDVNGDGVSDILYTIFGYGGYKIISGADGKRLWNSWKLDVICDMVSIGDVNSNGTGDFILAGIDGNLQSKVYCLEGSMNSIIWVNSSFTTKIEQVLLHQDHDLDGVNDVLVVSKDEIAILSGKNGTKIWNTWIGSEGDFQLFCDVNGDNFTEIVSDATTLNNIRDGSNGSILYSLTLPNTWVDILGDLTSDGIADLGCRIGGHYEGGGVAVYGIYNGATGANLWNHTTPTAYHFGFSISDVTGDGIPEVVLGTCSYDDKMYCLSGVTGNVIWSFDSGKSEGGLDIGDINGNGYNDVINIGFLDVACIEGNSQGALSWNPHEGENFLFNLMTIIFESIIIGLIITIVALWWRLRKTKRNS